MSGNGFDNAHNNQFGGGERGPTGGVNMGSGSSSGNTGGRGNGYWVAGPDFATPTERDSNGQVRIQITSGMNWVSDNSIHWSDGKGGSGNDNVRTNATAQVNNGFRAAVDGYIYMVTVNGNNAITGIYLYSRPPTLSRQNWAQTETARVNQARALVQAQLDAKKANEAALAKKAADEAAAKEAKRKADEEAKRKQAEWDAAHPIEAAQRDINNATNMLNAANSAINKDNAKIAANNTAIQSRQQTINQIVVDVQPLVIRFNGLMNTGNHVQANGFYAGFIQPTVDRRNALQSEIANLNAQNVALNLDLQAQINQRNASSAALSSAQTRLKAANAEAERKRQAEAKRQAEEAARVKAAQDAAAKAKAAAEAKAKAEAEAATKAAAKEAAMSKLEQPNVFGMSGFPAAMVASAAPITFAETGLGSLVLGDAVAAVAWTAVRSALADLLGAVIAGSGVGALIASVTYIPSAGEGSDKVPGREEANMFLSALPADAIKLPDDKTLNAAAAAKGTVKLAVRGRLNLSDKTFKTYLVRTTTPTPVRVVQAVRDEVTGLYGYTVPAENEIPSRTILVSPDKTPGYKGLPPLVTPQQGKITPNNTGNQSPVVIKPVIESFPMADDLDFRDFILVFPAETGMKPIYVMLQSGRDLPGKVEGKGGNVTGEWLAGAGKELGAPIPSQIADKLRGKEFRNFDAFRNAVWFEIGKDPALTKQFIPNNQELIKKGLSPFTRVSEQVGGRMRFELHHIKPISQGGDVYNVDNLGVVTPKRHIEIHKEGK